ncbi:MAG: TadE/TadG family type IV pilus assembly protein [Acidimicrobiia bacterium]
MRHRSRKDKGAALVEFAILMPLLVVLLLGIVEFGWALAQQIDVRHKARETLRLAIVDDPLVDIEARACEDDVVDSTEITQILLETDVTRGSEVAVTVAANVEQITGLFGAFWGPNPTITSRVEGRVEQDSSTFSDGQDLSPCP